MTNKILKIKDGIGTIENCIDDELCDNLVKDFLLKEDKIAYTRDQEGTSKKFKNDLSITYDKINNWDEKIERVCKDVSEAIGIYQKETNFMQYSDIQELHFTNIKIQKTVPGQGYHVWHIERSHRFWCRRALVFSIYLNTIEEGGETEFLILNQRIKPKKGTLVFFPTDYPYVHRGNPPLNQDKYLLTSWLLT